VEAEIGSVEALSLSSATFALAEAVERFYEVLYADHPYGRRPTVEDFSNLTVDDVKDFHEKFFVPGNMTLAIAGDINEAEVRASVRDLFGDMQATEAPPPRQIPAIEFEKAAQHTYPVKKLQSWLVIGHELPVVPLEDQAALDVMNYILAAEHLHARMLTNTRVLYGYTNDASGFLEDRWFGPGSYTFRSYSRPEVIRPLYEEMMSAIRSIQTEEVTAEELFIAKGALRDGTFPIRYLDGYSTARDFAIEWLRYGNHSRSASYTRRVGAVTAKDVFNMANKYIRTRSMQIVLLGESASLME
jgi:zinc protease